MDFFGKKSNCAQQLTTWEAACILTGNGVGAGILSVPYMMERCGIWSALLLIIVAYGISWVMHLMIACTVQHCGSGTDMISMFSQFLFNKRLKRSETRLFSVLILVLLEVNMGAYIVGVADVLTAWLALPPIMGKLLFYLVSGSLVFLGLKELGRTESASVIILILLVIGLAAASFSGELQPLQKQVGSLHDNLALFAMAMFAFSAFFAVPQVVEGLQGDWKKTKRAISIGLGNNLILVLVTSICALSASETVTEISFVGWTAAIGPWAVAVGDTFAVIAMMTTVLSYSLVLGNLLRKRIPMRRSLAWVAGTIPALLLALIVSADFLDYLSLGSGVIAVLVAVLLVPTYQMARRALPDMQRQFWDGWPIQVLLMAGYVSMAIGSL